MADPDEALAMRPAADVARALARREVGCGELLEHLLARIERWNPELGAIVALDPEGARARARAADAALARGESWGPLHGLPITIKDSIEVAGMPCACGAPELAEHRPQADAPAAARLREAGAIVFGKTNVPIYAGDFQTYNAVYGTTSNPWDPARTPGGSSGGAAAALAAGLTGLELGSDIGGSIRNPAHFCGVYGHKPSARIVPTRGHIPGAPGSLAEADLGVIGPLGRGAEDLALALDVVAGPDDWDARAWRLALPPPRAERLDGFRVAVWLDHPLCPVTAEVGAVLQAAIDAVACAGARVRPLRPPVEPADAFSVYLRLLYGVLGTGFPPAVLAAFDAGYPALAPDDRSLAAEMVRGASQPHRAWNVDHERRTQQRARWAELFREVDVVLCPVMPSVAFPHDQGPIEARTIALDGGPLPYFQQLFWAGHATAAGLPATVAPVGRGRSGLPVGLQIVGPYLEDRTPIAFARALADALGGFTAPPGYA